LFDDQRQSADHHVMDSSPEHVAESDPTGFGGLRVAAFESRLAAEMTQLIERSGGRAMVSPSMREVPFASNAAAVDCANRLMTGQIDVVILMTGVGFRHWLAAVERSVDRQRFLDSLTDCVTIVRGPKPFAAMREVGIMPTYRVPEPNTWREVLATIDQFVPAANQRICLQEYGKTNPSLIAGLEARGATVFRLRVYDWDLPEDIAPLEQNVRRLAAGEVDVALFTSAQQVAHVLEVADRHAIRDQVIQGLRSAVIASIGPSTSEVLRELDLPVDFEPTHAKLGQLVTETATASRQLRERKRRIRELLAAAPLDVTHADASWFHSEFMKACRREPTRYTPIWLMRQAGRYMPEYRAVREKVSFLELCKNPQLCSEVMQTAVRRLGVDAAIIFSDLLPILEPMGLDLEYSSGDGPVIHNPVRESSDIDRVVELENVDSLHFVIETVRQTRRDLPGDIPLIGFAGAPFTLASYVIEGGSSKNYLATKTLMYRDEGAWRELMERFARSITVYLNAQAAAGAQCVQLFDSWVGCLGPEDYRRYVLPFVKQIVAGIIPGVPIINFATGNPALVPLLGQVGAHVVGVDWRVRLDDAWNSIGRNKAIQGNLDPCFLLADRSMIRLRAKSILGQAAGNPGHIFNLGHGVLPQTPVEHVIALVADVHELSQK
jgi:uroporphyrinogen decarboxylase